MSQPFPNPFAIPEKRRRRPLMATLKGLCVLGAMLAAVLILQSHTRQWLLQRWEAGFAELSPGEQLERLLQINQLGDLAIEMVARQVAAVDDQVAQTAIDLLRERQDQWGQRDDPSLAAAHMKMLIGLEAVISDLPASRWLAVTDLLNHTVSDCGEKRSRLMADAYQVANHLLARLAGRSGQMLAEVTPAGSIDNPRPTERGSVPLSLAVTSRSVAQAADAAPPNLAIALDEPAADSQNTVSQDIAVVAQAVAATIRPEQTVHRVGATDGQQSVVHGDYLRSLDKAPLRTFDTRTVIGMLASQRTATRDQAVEELVHRGFSNEEIRLANQLAAPEMQVRLGLLESLGRRSDIDPRQWLLWLAEDPQREVRLRAVTALHAMNDPAVIAKLRDRLRDEADQTVIAALRQVVDRR